jgi:nitrous oxidase accessory protein NosD
MKKWLAIGIILLFVGTCFIPAIAQDAKKPLPTSRGNWLYVGGSGPGNYTKIQDAIDNASNGDKIYVFSGYYIGNITVSKSLQILGESQDTTIIDGDGEINIINIIANEVKISYFTLEKGKTKGIRMEWRDSITLSNLTIKNMWEGIFNWMNSNIIIDNVSFLSNSLGISVNNVYDCNITHCTFSDNSGGINDGGFYSTTHDGSLYIYQNIFIDNIRAIEVYNSNDSNGRTLIRKNTFQQNQYGIILHNCKNVGIIENNFLNNSEQAFMERLSLVRDTLTFIYYHQNWLNNYWDDLNSHLRYAILGTWTFCVGHSINLWYYPIFKIPYREFDSKPAKEPFDIPKRT